MKITAKWTNTNYKLISFVLSVRWNRWTLSGNEHEEQRKHWTLKYNIFNELWFSFQVYQLPCKDNWRYQASKFDIKPKISKSKQTK